MTLTQAWQQAAEQVWQYLDIGQDVAFVCEGDISFYSTFTYLAQTLQQLHPQSLIAEDTRSLFSPSCRLRLSENL